MEPRNPERLAHGWQLFLSDAVSSDAVRDFLRPAVEAVPPSIAARVGFCRVLVSPVLEGASSKWSRTARGFDIEIAAEGVEPHDLALELLRCLGQALWEELSDLERTEYLNLLEAEVAAGVPGEIDEDALDSKRALFAGREAARDAERLVEYASNSFAGTAAEYVHALWHDVTVRTGPEHLGPAWLRRRLEFLARRFPPARGRKVFG